ncbi:hypothetical protein BKA66DRAFT_573224 [Pyrenochaeta sp. MPI-SDFR-AT-0127]|nr:hypothetical protein BKA66DRAFT_573224 [Pyrenochaeta sp. MPI-SDFR-AT-0127]
MLLLLPLLLSSTLVTAAPHYARDRKIKTHVEVVTATVYVTAYETAQPVPTPPAEVVYEAGNAKSVAAYVPPQPEPTVASLASLPATGNGPAPASDKDQVSSKNAEGSSLPRMSSGEVDAIYKTCWNGQIKWPLPGTPNPVVDEVTPQLSIFPLPSTKPDTLIVHNYCSYDIYFNHFNGAHSLETGHIAGGASIERPLSGTVLKASKTADMAKDVLIEYAVAGDGVLYYDLSLITCLGQTGGLDNGDLSACAGHEAGLQLGNANSKSFQCAAGAWCDDQAYLYHENLCKKQNPVSSCSPSNGLTMEFCAGAKH